MIINHNMNAMNAHRNMSANTVNAGKSMEKLSSGLRINKAGDDAAGLAISEKMRGQIRGLDQASRNGQDAVSLIQTAEGGLNETHSILQRMRELGVQSATDTNTADDRAKIQAEVDQLAKEITRISNTTEFNTQNLLAGGLDNTFQIGANKDQNISLSINKMDATALGVSGDLVNYGLNGTNTGINSVKEASKDVKDYTIKTLASSAATANTDIGAAGAPVTKSDASNGAMTATAGSYNGSSDKSYVFKVTSVGTAATGNITGLSVSEDGGVSFKALSGVNNAASATTFTYDGLTYSIADAGNKNAVGSTYSLSVKAEYKQVQLFDDAGTPAAVGDAVKVYNNMSEAVIGKGDTTVKVNFTYSSLSGSAVNDKITKATTASASAVLGADGSITKEAVTYKGIDVSTQSAANSAIKTIDTAIKTVSEERSKLGAYQNRLEHTIANLNTSSENLQSSESRIRDVDMAKEMMNFSKNNILSQAAQAMLAQANSQPQGVLQLLR